MVPEVDDVLSLVRGLRTTSPDPFSHPVFRRLFARAASSTPDEQSAIVRDLASGLSASDPLQAACVALTCGTLVERGAAPETAGAAIVSRLESAARAAPDGRQALRWLGLASMACLARSPALRAEARRTDLADALEALESDIPEAWFVRRVLELVDDAELVVLAPELRVGFRVRIEAIRTNFHLFTLLQGALIGDREAGFLAGNMVAPGVIARAGGVFGPVVRDQAQFHFQDWTGLTGEGHLRRDLRSTIWGEGSPRDIPEIDGTKVVLVGPMVLGGRGWDSGFFATFHDALRSRVHIVAHLSPEEVSRFLDAISARSRQFDRAQPARGKIDRPAAKHPIATAPSSMQRLAGAARGIGVALGVAAILSSKGGGDDARSLTLLAVALAIAAFIVSWWASRRP
jgi:hypothetical protein